MIAAASLIGFALAALLAAWVGSALLTATVWLARHRLHRAGPAAERRAATLVLVGGPLVGAAVLLALLGHSTATALSGAGDHCAAHGHHVHLCVVHGAAWIGEPAAVVTLAMVAACIGLRLAARLVALVSASRAARRLDRVAVVDPAGVRIAPGERAFCFVAGLPRPRIYVSSRAWAALDAQERAGMLAHERAHLAQRDVLWQSALGACALVGAPGLAGAVLAWWNSATERLCDVRAAERVAPEAVASALVKMTRLGGEPSTPCLAFASADVVARVEALLAGPATGQAAARRLAWLGAASLLLLAAALVGFADPLHHAFETILGVF